MEQQHIQNELRELAPLLAEIPKLEVYTIPAGYFEHLPESALEAISGEEPALSWPKSVPGEVPEGYFDQLPEVLINRVTETGSSETRLPSGRVRSLSFLKWAVAAALAGAVLFSLWQNNSANETAAPEQNTISALDQISDEELIGYADMHPGATTPISDLSEETTTPVSTTMAEEDIQAMLADYATEELEEYLTEYSANSSVLN